MMRYRVSPLESGGWGIWDKIYEAYCGLPSEAGRHVTLEFGVRESAWRWLRACEARGLVVRTWSTPVPEMHSLTIGVYKVSRDGTRTTISEPHEVPGQETSINFSEPACECWQHQRRPRWPGV